MLLALRSGWWSTIWCSLLPYNRLAHFVLVPESISPPMTKSALLCELSVLRCTITRSLHLFDASRNSAWSIYSLRSGTGAKKQWWPEGRYSTRPICAKTVHCNNPSHTWEICMIYLQERGRAGYGTNKSWYRISHLPPRVIQLDRNGAVMNAL